MLEVESSDCQIFKFAKVIGRMRESAENVRIKMASKKQNMDNMDMIKTIEKQEVEKPIDRKPSKTTLV